MSTMKWDLFTLELHDGYFGEWQQRVELCRTGELLAQRWPWADVERREACQEQERDLSAASLAEITEIFQSLLALFEAVDQPPVDERLDGPSYEMQMHYPSGYQHGFAWHGPLLDKFEARFRRLVEILAVDWERFEE